MIKKRPAKDVIKEMEELARRINADVSTWKMGDELYEEIFQ